MTMSLKGSLCWPLVLCSLVPWGGGGGGGVPAATFALNPGDLESGLHRPAKSLECGAECAPKNLYSVEKKRGRTLRFTQRNVRGPATAVSGPEHDVADGAEA